MESSLLSAFAATTLQESNSNNNDYYQQQQQGFKEFRPGQGLVASKSAMNSKVESDLNVGAKEFTFGPSSTSVSVTDNTASSEQNQQPSIGYVFVHRNGERLHVPLEEAYLYDEDENYYPENHSVDDVAWWARGVSDIPLAELSMDRSDCVAAMHRLGVTDDMYTHFRNMAIEAMQEMKPDDPRHKAVPISYGNSYCLDTAATASSFGYPSSVFKVISREDGLLYCLRRLENVKCVSIKICSQVNSRWSNFSHPCCVKFQKCFIAQRAVFFVHEYHTGAKTLGEKYLTHTEGKHLQALPERLIWSYITQLVTAIRSVHRSRLACCCVEPNHILYTNGDRIRINCLGIFDALEFEARKSLGEMQREDMLSLGRVILSLASRTVINSATDSETIHNCSMFVSQHYSSDLHMLMISILTNAPSIESVSNAIANHALDELDMSFSLNDLYRHHLAIEYDSGRALRLLLKLGFVNERPEFGFDHRWSETGDCYILKLFRDFVFHQADESGRPVMDIGHIVTSLNKLDCCDSEKITLVSRDGKAILVVSYADVARCLEQAYSELSASASNASLAFG